MKRVLFFILYITFIACQEKASAPSSLLQFVPPKTAAILKTKDLSAFSSKIASNSFLKENKDLPFFAFFSDEFDQLKHLKLTTNSLLCFNKIGRNEIALTILTKDRPTLVNTEGITDKKVETFEYDTQKVKKYTLENHITYGASLNNVFVLSTSKLILENIIRVYNNKLPQDEELQKIYETASSTEASLFINYEEAKQIYGELIPNRSSAYLSNVTDWVELDLKLTAHTIQLNGVTTANTVDEKVINIFKGTDAQANEIATITPLNADGFYAFTYNDYEKLKNNAYDYRKKTMATVDNESLFETTKEIGVIYHQDRKSVVLNAVDVTATENALASSQEIAEEFRGLPIYRYAFPDSFYNALYPLIRTKGLTYYTIIDHFFVFSSEMQSLENIIANVQNQTVLGTQAFYLDAKAQLSDESSLLFVGINENLKNVLAESVSPHYKKAFQNLSFSDYKVSALQLTYDKNFAHVNAVFEKADKAELPNGAFQIGNIKLKEDLATQPQFVENWRSNNNDIAVQGESNTLYVYDFKGNLRWTKKLDGRIVGNIQQIDIYNNGRIQLAFATQNKFYILDKDGDEVSPFPVNFNDPITQPLAVFDYDHNSKYRFIITQGNSLLMLNKEGKTVKGFTFDKTKSTITQAPKHIRIGRKDYIVVPEENGELHILDRTGEARVSVNEKINFSGNEWYLYHDLFTSTNTDGNLVQIDQKGKLSTKDLTLSDHHNIDATEKTLVTFSENNLRIKDKTIELDFGLYTAPKIIYLNDKLYISITDTQAHKVYIFDSNAELLPGFPVYGNSAISMSNMDHIGHLEFTVQGEDDSILLYQLN